MSKQTREELVFKKQQHFLILWSISEAENGATGYELQKYIPIPRSTIYRFLRELEEDRLIGVKKQEHKGRLQKRYYIKAKGLKHLAVIRGAIFDNIEFMYSILASDSRPDIVQKLGDVPFLPIPPVLLGVLDYSEIRSRIQKAKGSKELVSNFTELEGVLLQVLDVHQDMLGKIKDRLSLVRKLKKKATKTEETSFDRAKKQLEASVPDTT
jgi:DNA-binding PadR family transcriptional regulator